MMEALEDKVSRLENRISELHSKNAGLRYENQTLRLRLEEMEASQSQPSVLVWLRSLIGKGTMRSGNGKEEEERQAA